MFNKEFKEAISNLPSSEKDKLIFRLLRKDLALANRLLFELVDESSVEERRQKMEDRVKKVAEQITTSFYSPGYLKMDMRYLSGEITEHVKITKDKYGEISLNLLMLIEVLKQSNEKIAGFSYQKTFKYCTYIIARAFKILLLIEKQHEDLHLDFKASVKELGLLIGESHYMMKTAIYHGLDVNWLIQFNLPEDLVEMHKELRANGYLK